MARRGYADNEPRIPKGWVLANVEQWPINTMHGPGPSPANWRFETYGDVKKPLSLTYEEFVKLPSITKKLDHHCIDGWSYLGHEWTGVDMNTIIQMTQPTDEVKFIHTEGERGYSSTFPVGQELLLAYKRFGKVLPRAGGYPVRLVAPGEFGYKSVKWVERVKFISDWDYDFWDKKLIAWGLPPIDPKLNPWNVDNAERKAGLRQLFIHLTEDHRREKIALYRKKLEASQ
ncbi:MAG TPA: molybdopterin-dependent oxidoreductase [Nitrososphaerales archaeon]